jgi:hypothetical protein
MDNEIDLLKNEILLLKNENSKLQIIVDEYNKKKQIHRTNCLNNMRKVKDTFIFCEACNENIRKNSFCNHKRTNKHLNNLNINKVEENNV